MKRSLRFLSWAIAALVLLAACALAYLKAGEPRGPVPPLVTPGIVDAQPPSDALRLFDGGEAVQWILVGGAMQTRASFKDFQLHLEWRLPDDGAGEAVLLAPGYELSLANRPAGVGGQTPLADARRKPGEWQAYDLIWIAPRFDASGAMSSPARITLLLNGVLIQSGSIPAGGSPYGGAPIGLRTRRGLDPADFRNIWLRSL